MKRILTSRGALTAFVAAAVIALSVCGPRSSTPPAQSPAPDTTEQAEVAPPPPSPSLRQEPQNSFLHRFAVLPGRGDGPLEHAVIVRAHPRGGVVALVSFDGTIVLEGQPVVGGYRNFAVVRLDAEGEILWTYAEEGAEGLGGEPQSRYANALTVAENGDIFVGGIFQETGPGFSLMRLSSEGYRRWLVEPSTGSNWSEIHDIAVDASGDLFAVGHFSERLAIAGLPPEVCSRGCGFVAKFDGSDGSPIWADHLCSPDGALVAVEVAGENAIVAGHFAPVAVVAGERLWSAGEHDIVAIRYNAEGEQTWGVRFGERRQDVLAQMVPLAEERVALATAEHLYLISEEEGELLWDRPLNDRLTLIQTSGRRDRVWLARHTIRPDGITLLNIAAFDAEGQAEQIGEMRTVVYSLRPNFLPFLTRRELLIGGAIADNRWDAIARTPFLLSTPLMQLMEGEAVERLPLRGRRPSSRCPAEHRRPEQPDPLELRRGLDRIRPEVVRCGVNPRALRFELEIAGRGRVQRAEVRSQLNFHQASCVTEALQQARFCPFRSESYTVETIFP